MHIVIPVAIGSITLIGMLFSKRKTLSILLGLVACIAFGYAILAFFTGSQMRTTSSRTNIDPLPDYISRMDLSEREVHALLRNPLAHGLVEGHSGNGKSYVLLQQARAQIGSFNTLLYIDFNDLKRRESDTLFSLLKSSLRRSFWESFTALVDPASTYSLLSQLSKQDDTRPVLLIVDHLESAAPDTMKELLSLFEHFDPKQVKIIGVTNSQSVADNIVSRIKTVLPLHVDEPSAEHLEEILKELHGITNVDSHTESFSYFNYKQLEEMRTGGVPEEKYSRIWGIIMHELDKKEIKRVRKLIHNLVRKNGVHFQDALDSKNSVSVPTLRMLTGQGLLRMNGQEIRFASKLVKRFFENNVQLYEDPDELMKKLTKELKYWDRPKLQRLVQALIASDENQVNSEVHPEIQKLKEHLKMSPLFSVRDIGTKEGEFVVMFRNAHLLSKFRDEKKASLWPRMFL